MTAKNFIDIRDFDKDELTSMLDMAHKMKSGANKVRYLDGLSLGMLFSVASTRTRISFQQGVRELGGVADYYDMKDLQLINKESLRDTSVVLGRYLDGLIVRNYDMERYGEGRKSLEIIADQSKLPVINALDDKDHPCQAMTDVFTMQEKLSGDLRKRKIVLTWAYAERKKSPGVPHSLMTLSSIMGLNVTVAHPKGFELDEEYVEFAKSQTDISGGNLQFSNDLEDACKDADVIYAKSWKALSSSSEEDLELRENARTSWRVEQRHMSSAKPEAYFMNCMPLIRGQQASAEVVDGLQSIIYDQAENRLHMQKAILAYLFEARKK